MSIENALENLRELAKTLDVMEPELDENLSCCLECSEDFSVHFLYDEATEYLYLYVPLLDGLPKEIDKKAALYEVVLERSLQLARLHMGRVGLDRENDLLLFFDKLPMHDADKDQLTKCFPSFLEIALLWKDLTIKSSDSPEDGFRV